MPKISAKEKKRNKFADVVLCICIGTMFVATMWTLWGYQRLDEVVPSDVFKSFCQFWGAEVITVALRQVFGSDVFNSARKEKESDNVCSTTI